MTITRFRGGSSGAGRRLGVGPRFMISLTALLVLVIGGVAFQTDRAFDRRIQHELNSDLAEEVPEYSNAADFRPPGQRLDLFTITYLRTHFRPQRHALLIALQRSPVSQAAVLATPEAEPLRSAPLVLGWLRRPPPQPVLTDVTAAGRNFRVFVSPISLNGQRVGTLVAAADLSSLERNRRNQLRMVLIEALVALGAAVVGGWLLLRRLLRVISQVTGTAEEITSGDLSRRLNFTGPDDELGRLARTVDRMLDRLEAAFVAQRELLSDVSHQLRTPLTVVRGHLDVLSRTGYREPAEVAETVALVIDELDQLSLMIERLLLLGQSLEPDFLAEQPVALADLLTDVHEAARFLGDRSWELGPVPAVAIRADRTKLRGALLNLADNSVKATVPGQLIRLDAWLADDGVVLQVSDTGRGLSAAEREVVVGRFVRVGGTDYRGSGLGLAIVQAVARAHGGRLELDSEPGRGCSVRIILPAERIVAEQPAGAATPAGAG